jgi:hypothetical protein
MKLKEQYNNMVLVFGKIKYHEHQWVICMDFKLVNFLPGQQSSLDNTLASCALG